MLHSGRLFHRSLSLYAAAAAILMVPPQNTPKKKKKKKAQTQDNILNTRWNSRLFSSPRGHFYP